MPDTCLRCGSKKIIPGVPLLDHFGDWGLSSSQVKVTVDGAPRAFVFKDSASGSLTVHVCGDCGHAELSVSDFGELYRKYEQSRQS